MNTSALKDFLNQKVEIVRTIRDRGEVLAPEENYLWHGHCNVMIRAFKEVLEEIERLEAQEVKINDGHYINLLDEMQPRASPKGWLKKMFWP